MVNIVRLTLVDQKIVRPSSGEKAWSAAVPTVSCHSELQALATASGPRYLGTSLRPKSEPIQSQRRIDVINVGSDADG
jgi:hypothetical protein